MLNESKKVALSFTSNINVIREFVSRSIDDDNFFFEFVNVSIEINFQFIDAFILSNIVTNVFERIKILIFKKNKKIKMLKRMSFEFRT